MLSFDPPLKADILQVRHKHADGRACRQYRVEHD
jgi:hypothetical protein